MSYDNVMLADCGAVNPLTGAQCSMPPHNTGPHEGNGYLWGTPTPPEYPDTKPVLLVTSANPRVVEAFAFGLFSTGAKLNGVTMERATNLWRGSTVEDRAMWLDRARGVVDAAVTYEP